MISETAARAPIHVPIRLFHYRNYGAEYGRVLLGIQVPPGDEPRLLEFLENTGYNYKTEDDNPAFPMFVGPRKKGDGAN